MNMEFLSRNLINTTSMIAVNTGTSTISYMYDRKPLTKFIATGNTITVSFLLNAPLSRIILEGINFMPKTILLEIANTIEDIINDKTGRGNLNIFSDLK